MKSMHFGGQDTGADRKGIQCIAQVDSWNPHKWYFKDESNFLIYCIWMCNMIGFVLNIKFANVTYCTREWKERLNFFKNA